MQSQPLRRAIPPQSAEAFSFEAKLENEEAILDAILASMARGNLPAGTWERLHAASQRDARLSELAFAFEGASQGKRLKALTPALAAEFLFQAACFFADVFGDELGAVTYLERALALVPAHWPSFGKIEQILRKTQQPRKLADVCATVALHRPRGEQPGLLRRAADLLLQAGGADDKAIELLQHVLRLDPADEQTRSLLEEICVKANRLRDVVRLNEQALAVEPPPDEPTRRKVLARIVEVYADRLHEPERAMPYVEQLLSIDPANELGRRVAQKLVVVKGLAGRAAAALANAHDAFGTPQDVARFVSIELENTRGPKRAALLIRLGTLRADRMDDDAGAFEAFEQALAIDADDDELRVAYATLAHKLGRHADAARTLGRVLATVKSPASKARAGAQLGEALVRGGDLRRAKATLAAVLVAPEAPSDAILAAAHALSEIYLAEGDKSSLCEMTERVALLEPDPDKRRAADERLAQLATEAGDVARAIGAYERLLTTSLRPQALAALEPLYEAGGDPEKHARLLEEQAKDMLDPQQAREAMMRAAEVRAKIASDGPAAIQTCLSVIDRFGPARDVLALVVPLLEAQRRWPELARALVDDAGLSSGVEHAQLMSRIGALRMQRLGDVTGAIEAFGQALAIDEGDRTARMMLEKLTVVGDHRLAAARVLEPLYRHQGTTGSLLKMLELRGTLEPDVDERLLALHEAAQLADGVDAGRAVEVVGRALADAVAHNRALGVWLERLDSAAAAGTDGKRRAALLSHALGDRDVTSDDLSVLAKRAAEAHAAAGEAQAAIDLYRRALSFEPHSAELLSRVDDLLRDQGSPLERVALYRAALARGGTARRRGLLHRIGAIERHDLGDAAAAIETYRTALADDADDADAQSALADLYAQTERWDDLCALLEARLSRVEGESSRAIRATLAGVAAAHGDEARAREQCARLLDEPELSIEHLDAVAQAAEAIGDATLERAVLVRRVESTQDSREQVGWLVRLAELDEERRGDSEAAALAWKRAAALAEGAGDDDAARRLYGRARRHRPEDREIVTRLASLCERAQVWEDIPQLFVSLAAQSTDDAERIDLWLRTARVLAERLGDMPGAAHRAGCAFELAPGRADVLSTFEELSLAAGTLEAFELAVDEALTRPESGGTLDGAQRARILLSRARALAHDSRRADDAAQAYRAILRDATLDPAAVAGAVAAFEVLVAADSTSPPRRADRRWLLEWRAGHAPEAQRSAKLLDWAREEETTFADPSRALELYRRVLELDPESDEALSAVARLALVAGDADQALAALGARRDRADGAARIAIELEIAQVVVSRTNRWQEALPGLRAVFAEMPNHTEACALAVQLLGHPATRVETIRMLEGACEATDDAAARAQTLVRLLDATAAAGDEPLLRVQRRAWFERLCDLQRELLEPEAAMATAVRATHEMPEVAGLWDRAEGMARALARPEQMAALYEELLARPLAPEQARAIGERAVQFYEEWFEDSGRVVRILDRVLEIDPSADWAFDRLKLLLDADERWDELFALYDRALAVASDRNRPILLEDAAQTAKDFANRPERAIDYLEQLHRLKPADSKLTSALERLYERQGRHRELVASLANRLPELDADQARSTRVRIAVLWLEALGDPSAALEAIEPVLEGDAVSSRATPPKVWALLEQILAAAPSSPEVRRSTSPPTRGSERPRAKRTRRSEPSGSLPPSSSVRQRVAARLRDHYGQTGREVDLVRMLLVELEAVKPAAERVRRHLEIAEVYERLSDPGAALEQVGHALELDPHDDVKRAKLADLAERAGRPQRFAEWLTAAAYSSDDRPLRVALTMQAAAVRADRLGDSTGAIELLNGVLGTSGLSDDELLAAGHRLEPLLEGAGRQEERLNVLDRMANVEPSGDARRNLLGRAAQLAARLGQDARAVALWEKRLAVDPSDAEALDGLVELLDRTHGDERLAEVLALRAKAATNDERRRADRVRVATLLGAVLDRSPEAIVAWHEIERDFGEADDAAVALAALLQTMRRWDELAKLLERRAARAPDESVRADLLWQLGDVLREQLDARSSALETYGRALASNPHNPGARAGLLALANDDALRAAAVTALLAALRASDDWQAVLELTPHRLLACSADADRVDVLLETAKISEQRAGDPAAAFDSVRRAFVISPGDESVEREVTRLAEAANAWGRLADSYREAVEGAASTDPGLTAKLRAHAGATLETKLDDARGALAEYLRVVRDTRDVEVACAALRVAGRLAAWDVAARVVVEVAGARPAASSDLLDAYARAAEASGAWDEAATALANETSAAQLAGVAGRDVEGRIAEWHRDRRGDPDAAQAALVRALAHDDSDSRLLVMLVELQRRDGGRTLVDSLLRLSSSTGGDLALMREAAQVASDSVRDLALARSILADLLSLSRRRWIEQSSDDARGYAQWSVETLAQLHEEENDLRAVVDVLQQGDALPFDLDVRRAMRRRAARIGLDRLGDLELATALYLALFEEDRKDAEATSRLASIFTARGQTRELLNLRQRQVAATDDRAERIALRLESAQLLVTLGESERAAEVLTASLEEDARHEATVAALATLFDSNGRSEDLCALLVNQAERAEGEGDGTRAAELWGRAAVVAEERLGDRAAAEAHHVRVAAIEARPASLDALGRLATTRGDHAAAARWLERLLPVVESDRKIEATLRLADAIVGTGEPERAVARLVDSLVDSPQAEPLRERLATLYRDQGEWERLAAITADAATYAPDKASRLARLRDAAKLYSDRCEKPALAVPLLEQAIDLAPDDQSAALALADALANAGRFEDSRALLKGMVDAFAGRRPKERAPVHYQIARLELAMGNRAGALVELDVAARVDPQNPDILRALAELARDDGQMERAEKSYRALLVILRRREQATQVRTVARSEVLLELSALADRQGERERAAEILESALDSASQEDFEQERLESALRARGDDETLVRVLEAKLARVDSSAARAKTLAELADVLANRLGRSSQALSVWLRAAALEPRSDAMHDSALALARATGQVRLYADAATELVERALEQGDAPLARSLLVRLGEVAEQDLHDDAAAASKYERAVELGLLEPEVLRALDRVFDRLGDTVKQARVLSTRIEVEEQAGHPRAASDAIYRLAGLRFASPTTVDEGVDLMQKALSLDPQLDRAEDALRRAVALSPGHRRLIDLYEHVARQPGHERALVHALSIRSELPGEASGPIREAVDVAVRACEYGLAEALLVRAVERYRTSSETATLQWALDGLANLRRAAGDVRGAIELKREAARIADADVSRKLTFEVARLAADELGDWDIAAEAYEGLCRIDPADRDAWEPLLAVYRRQGQSAKLAALVSSVVDFVEDARVRARLRLERVRALQEVGLSDAEAAPLLREVVDEDAGQVEAALMLASIHERAGAHGELAKLLARQIDSAKDRNDAVSVVSLSVRLGALLEPSDRMQARDAYYTGLEWEPQSRTLLDGLLGLLAADGDAAERAEVIERRLALEEGPGAEPMALALSSSRAQLGDDVGAERALQLGFRLYPASAALRDRLEAIFRGRGEWTKVAELCVLDAKGRSRPEERVARLREAATIWRTELSDPRSAAAALGLAREAAQGSDDAEAMAGELLRDHVESLFEGGEFGAAAAELSTAVERLAADDPGRAALFGVRAVVWAAAGDESAALEDLEAAFAIDGATYAADLAGALDRQCARAAQAEDAAALRALRLRQARVLPLADDAQGARAILADLLKQDPKDRASLRALANLEWSLERWDAASAALKRLVGLEEADATVETALRLADACERAGRAGDARGGLERARVVAPHDRAVRQRLERVYEQMGEYAELSKLVVEEARATGDVADRFQLLLRAGCLLLERAKDAAGSVEILEEARALRPQDPECAGLLADAYTLSGRARDAIALIEPIIALQKGRRSREFAPLYWRLARAARYFGNTAEEARALSHAFECDSQNGQVCGDVSLRALELDQLDLASRALRAITLLKTPGPMSKAVAYQHMGEIARRQGDTKRALMLLHRALTEDPGLDGARVLVESIERLAAR